MIWICNDILTALCAKYMLTHSITLTDVQFNYRWSYEVNEYPIVLRRYIYFSKCQPQWWLSYSLIVKEAPQGIAVDYCYLFLRQCLSIKDIAIKKVYLVTHCHYETKSTITVTLLIFWRVRCWSPGSLVKMTVSQKRNDWKRAVY